VFGIDVKAPGLLVAVVARSPVFGGKVQSFDAAKAKALPASSTWCRSRRASPSWRRLLVGQEGPRRAHRHLDEADRQRVERDYFQLFAREPSRPARWRATTATPRPRCPAPRPSRRRLRAAVPRPCDMEPMN